MLSAHGSLQKGALPLLWLPPREVAVCSLHSQARVFLDFFSQGFRQCSVLECTLYKDTCLTGIYGNTGKPCKTRIQSKGTYGNLILV